MWRGPLTSGRATAWVPWLLFPSWLREHLFFISVFMALLRWKEVLMSYKRRSNFKQHILKIFLIVTFSSSVVSSHSIHFLDFPLYSSNAPSTPSASFLPYLLNFKVHFTFCGLQFLFNNSRILLKTEVEKVLKSDRKTVHRYIKSRLLREIYKRYSDYSYKYFLIWI